MPLHACLISAESPPLVLCCVLIFPSRLRRRKPHLLQGCRPQRKRMLMKKTNFKQLKRCVPGSDPLRSRCGSLAGDWLPSTALSPAAFLSSQFPFLSLYVAHQQPTLKQQLGFHHKAPGGHLLLSARSDRSPVFSSSFSSAFRH